MATSPPGLNHIRAQDSLDLLRARLGQEQFERAQAKAMAFSSDEALNLASRNKSPSLSSPMIAEDPPIVRAAGVRAYEDLGRSHLVRTGSPTPQIPADSMH